MHLGGPEIWQGLSFPMGRDKAGRHPCIFWIVDRWHNVEGWFEGRHCQVLAYATNQRTFVPVPNWLYPY